MEILVKSFVFSFSNLFVSSVIMNESCKRKLILCLLASGLNLGLYFAKLTQFGSLLALFGISILLVTWSCKFKSFKRFLQWMSVFALCSLIFVGIKTFSNAYFENNFLIEILLMASVTSLVWAVFGKIHRRQNIKNFYRKVVVELEEKSVSCTAFLDSGNLLFDPLSQKPVILINFKFFLKLFPNFDLTQLTDKNAFSFLPLAHYVSFKTLGGNDKMLVFQVKKISVDGKEVENAVLGLSLQDFNKSFGTDMILHNAYAGV